MDHKSAFSLFFISSLLMAEPLSQEQMVQKGSEVSTALVQKLGGDLKSQMLSGGPMTALHFCSQNALSLTEQIAKEYGTSIKRVSIQSRNPVNAATSEEKSVLNEWQTMINNKETLPPYKLTKLSNGKAVYFKPIFINNETCLKCHGDISVDSPLGKAIKETYPEDQATGYKMGDLRGMIAVSF
jgi:hypothetical protein